MIIMNKPKVKTIAGRDNITSRGFRNVLIIARNKPPIIKSIILVEFMLELNSPEAINKPKELTNHLIKNLTIGFFILF